MDIIFILIAMAVFYILPEILKRRQPKKEYEYPQIPDRVPPPEIKTPREVKPPPLGKIKPVSVATKAQEPVVVVQATPDSTEIKTVAPLASETTAWQDKLDQAAVLNGIIYAEILQPPRALRPLRPGRRSGR